MESSEDVHRASCVGQTVGGSCLLHQGSSDVVAISSDQLLTPYPFGQRQGLAGQRFGSGPVSLVESQFGQIADDGSCAVDVTDRASHP
jgi:hypothetical protein